MAVSHADEARERVGEICGIPPKRLRVVEMAELDAYRVYEPQRGGVRVIIGRDGSLLFAASALTTDAASDLYKAGERTDGQIFDDLRRRNRDRYADRQGLDA